ncbi:MAG: CRISPR-associated endonuclease Cas1 [Acidobacteria bacterium]|nr:CRISPR-associated endonuclease Cas1 [Acidobacteriota bacterium]
MNGEDEKLFDVPTEAVEDRSTKSPAELIRPEVSTWALARPAAQLNLFTGKPELVRVEVPEPPQDAAEIRVDEGVRLVKDEESSQIILSGYGLFLSKKSERLLVKKGKEVIYQFPLFRITDVVLMSHGISLSADLVDELCQRGIRLSFLDSRGQPYAMLTSPHLTATVQARRHQLLAFQDRRGLDFAKAVVIGKIRNQERLLRYFGKYIKQIDGPRFEELGDLAGSLRGQAHAAAKVEGSCVDECRGTLMGLEGTAGRLYWDGVRLILDEKAEFFGRQHQGASDAVNSMLNYGYGILYAQVWGAVLNAGLEPFAGFLHVDRPGKPSLVLDLVEEFRQPVVDRVVLSHVNLGSAVRLEEGMLDVESRRAVAERVLERLATAERYSGKKYQVRSIIQMQARRLASFLQGGSSYKSFAFKW